MRSIARVLAEFRRLRARCAGCGRRLPTPTTTYRGEAYCERCTKFQRRPR